MPSSSWERKLLYGKEFSERGGVLGLIKKEFGLRFTEKKYCIHSSIQPAANNVKDGSQGIIIDMTQQAHGGARRVYGEWNGPKILHISSLDDAGQGFLGENDWMSYIFHRFEEETGLNKNFASKCGGGPGKHIIDFKPFSFRMFYEYQGKLIPILSVQIEIDVNVLAYSSLARTQPLCKVSINGVDNLAMCSKSGAYKISNADFQKKCPLRYDWWHLQLMQKYIGDFLPVVYSIARDSYYTTGDNMAIVQYLNMVRTLKTPGVKTRMTKIFNNGRSNINNRWGSSDAKFKIFAEDGKEGLLRLFASTATLKNKNPFMQYV